MGYNLLPLFIISAPSGTGKTTIYKKVQQILPNLVFSISYTTRFPRPGEKNAVDYFFVTEEEFKAMINRNQFLEWAEVHGNYYGTSKKFIEENRRAGDGVILDIDVQGAMQLKKLANLEAIFIFIKPPSFEELTRRLISRGTESQQVLEKRIENAKNELSYEEQYDYVIINDNLDVAVKQFLEVIDKESGNLGKKAKTTHENVE